MRTFLAMLLVALAIPTFAAGGEEGCDEACVRESKWKCDRPIKNLVADRAAAAVTKSIRDGDFLTVQFTTVVPKAHTTKFLDFKAEYSIVPPPGAMIRGGRKSVECDKSADQCVEKYEFRALAPNISGKYTARMLVECACQTLYSPYNFAFDCGRGRYDIEMTL